MVLSRALKHPSVVIGSICSHQELRALAIVSSLTVIGMIALNFWISDLESKGNVSTLSHLVPKYYEVGKCGKQGHSASHASCCIISFSYPSYIIYIYLYLQSYDLHHQCPMARCHDVFTTDLTSRWPGWPTVSDLHNWPLWTLRRSMCAADADGLDFIGFVSRFEDGICVPQVLKVGSVWELQTSFRMMKRS